MRAAPNPGTVDRFPEIDKLAKRLRDELGANSATQCLLLYAYNGTGKTRLSMEFKEKGKTGEGVRDTLYFNAFTEDLFTWDNDLDGDSERVLRMNTDSQFFAGLAELEMDTRIQEYLRRYADFEFAIDYDSATVRFSREQVVQTNNRGVIETTTETVDNIKVSRGEENLFIWCFFLAVAQLALDGAEAYKWVKYLYIDDPISSLDDNNTIAVACDLAGLLKKTMEIKSVVSSHHGLFYNVLCKELAGVKHKQYFLHRGRKASAYTLRKTDETPFFHHVAMLEELQRAIDSNVIHTYHFNTLRTLFEKTASFLGYEDFKRCIHGLDNDEALFNRALNLFSHGGYSIYDPREMGEDNRELFKRVFAAFVARYQFEIPNLTIPPTQGVPDGGEGATP
jgi:hypothetical protein